MSREMTPALVLAWKRAAGIAHGEGRDRIDPLDLLRGLLAEDEGHAAQSLAAAGLDLSSWTFRFPDDARVVVSDQDLEPSAALRLVMTRAQHEAGRLTEEGSLSSDQALSALLALGDGIEGALAGCGFDGAVWKRTNAAATAAIPLDEPLDLTEPDDRFQALRIIDAAGNRAREALRVIEDHARFALNDALLSRMCKELRHDLASVLTDALASEMLISRDTLGDVGATISTPREGDRGSLAAVLAANAKRLQEALRSLEEFGKILGPSVGAALERLRYRSYTLEKALVLGGDARQRLANARLYALVTESACRASLLGTVRELAEGGVDIVQLREKGIDDRTLLDMARGVREVTRRCNVLFILNDRPDLAVLCDADGVHLGQDDVSLRDARRIVGPRMLIGVSTHDIGQVRQAALEGASYLGVGPTFPSKTKNFANFAGLSFVAEVANETSLPAFAIGGVNLETLAAAREAGATRVAVSNALCTAEDPRQAAAAFRKALQES
ncbi:MAG: thiamine phosphate synthase [Planctomycetota bacterium]